MCSGLPPPPLTMKKHCFSESDENAVGLKIYLTLFCLGLKTLLGTSGLSLINISDAFCP